MTYNYFNELCGSFKKCALSQAREPVNSSYLGKRAMEKVGQRNIFRNMWQSPYMKPLKWGGQTITDVIIPAAVGDAAFRGDESLVPSSLLPSFMSGGGLRGRKEMERYDTGKTKTTSKPDIQSGVEVKTTTPIFAERPQTVGGKGDEPTGARQGLPTEIGLGLAMGSAALGNPRTYVKMTRAGLREYSPKWTEGMPIGRFGKSEGTDVLSGAMDEFLPPLKKKAIIAMIGAIPVAAHMAGQSANVTGGLDEGVSALARASKRVEATITRVDEMVQDFEPAIQDAVENVISSSDEITQIAVESALEAKESIGGIATIVDTLEREFPLVFKALQKAGETFESGGHHMRVGMESVGGGVQGLTDMLQNAGRTAMPVGAGALGGYVLANLLGKQAPARESERDREKREKQQHLINLLAGAGGGALGFYMKSKFGSPEAAATDGPAQPTPSTIT